MTLLLAAFAAIFLWSGFHDVSEVRSSASFVIAMVCITAASIHARLDRDSR